FMRCNALDILNRWATLAMPNQIDFLLTCQCQYFINLHQELFATQFIGCNSRQFSRKYPCTMPAQVLGNRIPVIQTDALRSNPVRSQTNTMHKAPRIFCPGITWEDKIAFIL